MILRFFVLTREKPNTTNRSLQSKATTRQALRCRKNRPLSQVLINTIPSFFGHFCYQRLCDKANNDIQT